MVNLSASQICTLDQGTDDPTQMSYKETWGLQSPDPKAFWPMYQLEAAREMEPIVGDRGLL